MITNPYQNIHILFHITKYHLTFSASLLMSVSQSKRKASQNEIVTLKSERKEDILLM